MDYDLNIKPKSGRDRERKTLALRAIELGYHGIAWNLYCYGKLNNQIKPIPHVEITLADYKSCDKFRNMSTPRAALRQFSRLTFNIEELSDAQSLSSNDSVKRFDLLAVSTTNMKVFAFLCKTADIDIISLDFTQRFHFSMNKKLLDIAVARGIHFEIQYAPLITAPNTRKKVMSSVVVLIQYLKGKHLILSSGCESSVHLRSPLDVSFLAQLLGIPIHKSRKTLSDHCSQVIKHSIARRARYLPMEILSSADFQSKWLECHWEDVQKDSSEDSDLLAQLAASPDSDEAALSDEEGDDEGEGEEEDEGEDEEDSSSIEVEIEESRSPTSATAAETETRDEETNSPVALSSASGRGSGGLGSLDFIQFDDALTVKRGSSPEGAAAVAAEEDDEDDELVMSLSVMPRKRAAPVTAVAVAAAESSGKKKQKLRQSPSPGPTPPPLQKKKAGPGRATPGR